MTRKMLVLGILAFFCSGFAMAESPAAPKENAGYALLDMFIDSFQEMARHGSGGADVVEGKLAEMASDARASREKGEIDLVFYTRYSRILAMTKLFIKPDPANILKPVIDRELADFLKTVTGEEPDRSGGPAAIGQVANALAEEIINLHIYLDTKPARDALRKKLEERMNGAE